MRKLEKLVFDNQNLKKLPVDKETKNYLRKVSGAWFSLVDPTPMVNPKLVCASKPALDLLDLDFSETKRDDFAEYFSGNKLIPGSQTAAHCYCGHQFGHFAGQLGDGAAIYLGEVVNSRDEKWEIQLKGAGKTPFSRNADGRKVLRSSIREFLCSEMVHFLGIPSTRAGTIVTSDTQVQRDLFYTGKIINEKASVILRIAPSFIRFGSFEVFIEGGSSPGNKEMQKTCIDYVCNSYFPENIAKAGPLEVYKEIVRRTADLVASWQCIGWCHGVLNTDNMSILGLTIDYGPFGWLESYDDDYICNGSDEHGRYSYKNQPSICKWNCMKLAEAWDPTVPAKETKAWLESNWDKLYQQSYVSKMKKKLGILKSDLDVQFLLDKLHECFQETATDFTLTFRALIKFAEECKKRVTLSKTDVHDFCETAFAGLAPSPTILAHKFRVKASKMKSHLPIHQLQQFLQMAEQQPEAICHMFQVPLAAVGKIKQELSDEIDKFKQQGEHTAKQKSFQRMSESTWHSNVVDTWSAFLYEYQLHLAKEDLGESITVMEMNNPHFVLRNWIAQEAIAAAEAGDYSLVQKTLEMCCSPYKPLEDPKYGAPNETWSFDHCVTCSS